MCSDIHSHDVQTKIATQNLTHPSSNGQFVFFMISKAHTNYRDLLHRIGEQTLITSHRNVYINKNKKNQYANSKLYYSDLPLH